jgi:hypothetical protein
MEGLVAVSPKTDCPHCTETEEHVLHFEDFSDKNVNDPCIKC